MKANVKTVFEGLQRKGDDWPLVVY